MSDIGFVGSMLARSGLVKDKLPDGYAKAFLSVYFDTAPDHVQSNDIKEFEEGFEDVILNPEDYPAEKKLNEMQQRGRNKLRGIHEQALRLTKAATLRKAATAILATKG
jgi:hypothetical protein